MLSSTSLTPLRRDQLTRAAMHEYQDGPDGAVQFLKDNPFSALFIDTGLGKTIISLTLLDDLFQKFEFNRALVIAPLRVAAQTWPNEIPQWEHTAYLNYQVLRAEDDDAEVIEAGKAAYQVNYDTYESLCAALVAEQDLMELGDTPEGAEKYGKWLRRRNANSAAGKARTAMKEELRQKRLRSKASVHIIDADHLEWLVNQFTTWKKNGKGRKKRIIKDWPYDTIIIDESSMFKDHSTVRFKALQAVRTSGYVTRLHELTATPASETYLHLFPQLFLLDLGKRLGRNITAYRERYFTQSYNGFTWKIRPGAEEEISEVISDICLVMKSRDYLDEKEPLFLPRRLLMTDTQMSFYKEFENNSVIRLGDHDEAEIVEAITAGDLTGKLCQLASGAIYRPSGGYELFHEHKIEDLRQLQEELGPDNPIFVAYWYQHTKDRLRTAFPKMKFMDKKGAMVGPWNDGKLKHGLAAHPQGVSHGLNMQYGPGHDVYMMDMPFSREKFYQFWRRVARQGQKRECRVHLPQMVGTIDFELVEAQRLKEDAEERLFRYIKAVRARINKEDTL